MILDDKFIMSNMQFASLRTGMTSKTKFREQYTFYKFEHWDDTT
jgi:hypothetical protein